MYKIRISATDYDCMFGTGEKFIERYGEKLSPYNFAVEDGGKGYIKAYITVSKIEDLLGLSKLLCADIILYHDDINNVTNLEISDWNDDG